MRGAGYVVNDIICVYSDAAAVTQEAVCETVFTSTLKHPEKTCGKQEAAAF